MTVLIEERKREVKEGTRVTRLRGNSRREALFYVGCEPVETTTVWRERGEKNKRFKKDKVLKINKDRERQ